MMPPFDSPFGDFLEELPQAGFFSMDMPFGSSPNQQEFFRNSFQDVQNAYLGALGQQVREGMAPTLRFQNFLQDFPFTRRFGSIPPAQRGGTTSRFAPSTPNFFAFNS